MKGRRLTLAFASIVTALGLSVWAGPSGAQDGAEFFKGKTVTYIVATAPGGGYDNYGRLVAEYMQKYLPGSTFIVRNMPGAGHLLGTNTIYASRPDGLTIGTFNTGLIYNQLIGLDAVKFDLSKMSWIGKAASDPRVIVVASHSPIQSFEDLKNSNSPVTMGTAGVGSSSYADMVILANALKLPVKVVTGFNGNEELLAMRRGELQGTVASRSSYQEFVRNGYGRFLVQIGGKDSDVPQLGPAVSDPSAAKLVALIQSQGDIARLTAGPPGIPISRLQALRTAYRKAMEDPELREKAQKLGLPVDPAYGEQVENAISEALRQPPETVSILKLAMAAPSTPAAPVEKGTIVELKDGGRGITVKLANEKTIEAAVSGSRTEIRVAGKTGDRNSLKVGLVCAVDVPSAGGEAKAIDCD